MIRGTVQQSRPRPPPQIHCNFERHETVTSVYLFRRSVFFRNIFYNCCEHCFWDQNCNEPARTDGRDVWSQRHRRQIPPKKQETQEKTRNKEYRRHQPLCDRRHQPFLCQILAPESVSLVMVTFSIRFWHQNDDYSWRLKNDEFFILSNMQIFFDFVQHADFFWFCPSCRSFLISTSMQIFFDLDPWLLNRCCYDFFGDGDYFWH